MKNFAEELKNDLEKFSLLKHPFYQAWNEGKLSQETLQFYARQYRHHVDAFPRYISATHSMCEKIEDRQILLENLIDEEKGSKHHPELWMQFAEGLGQSRDQIKNEAAIPEIENVVNCFMGAARSSYEKGLGALFAYEHQVPKVAETKIDGLKKFYGIADSATLEFFEVHKKADEYHSEAVSAIVNQMNEEAQAEVRQGATEAAESLWNFLTGVCQRSNQDFSEFGLKAA